MKRVAHRVVVLLLCALMVFSLSACQDDSFEPENVAALWNKIDQTMNALESVELVRTTNVVYYSTGYRFEFSGTTNILTADDTHYTESKNVLSCEELSLNQTKNTVEAYYNGKMYTAVNDGTYDQKFCSEMTHEEYDGRHHGELTDEISVADCTTSQFSADDTGNWHLSFSGYTKKTVDQALEIFGLKDNVLGVPVEDMIVQFTADEAFRVKDVQITFSFADADGEATPEFSVKTVYSGYNTATFDPARLQADAYVLVEDVRILDTVANALEQRKNDREGQFVLSLNIAETYQGKTRTSSETSTLTYGWKNNAYFYQLDSNVEGQSFQVIYQGGEQTVTSDGQTYTVPTPETEAKAYIDNLIDSARYNPSAITNIEKVSDGVHKLISNAPNVSDYVSGITIGASHQEITVTFDGATLMKIESQVTLEGAFDEDQLSMTIQSSVDFFKTTQIPETE